MSVKPASTAKYANVKTKVASLGLHTVCEEAHCPNITECWSGGTATFMVLGGSCTRGCRFCSVPKRKSGDPVDTNEPEKLAEAISEWKLSYAVITSVCRDDLPDQGSAHFARCVAEIKKINPDTIIELLIPDFMGSIECIRQIAGAGPDVIGHNIETVERISPEIRDRRASYAQSLHVLSSVKEVMPGCKTKSAIMLGLGETDEEVVKAMEDLRNAHVDFLAIGQYLRPSKHHVEVAEYIKPERFAELRQLGKEIGFAYVAAGPFVRSSYRAGEHYARALVMNGGGPTC